MRGEGGQATVEWVGLVLLAALALGALAAFRGPAREPQLGRALAERITCATAGSCGSAGAAAAVAGARARSLRAPAVAGTRESPPRAPPVAGTRARSPSRPRSRARAVDAFRSLRSAGAIDRAATVVKRLWIVCLGYRRFRYELEHPRAPSEPMPLAEALDIANTCLNPASFLTED